jgi:signal transduction histidine kinase
VLWRVPAQDVALAILIGVLSLISFSERSSLLLDTVDGPAHFASPDIVGVLQVAIGCAALCWRRVAPGTVLAVTVVSAIGRYAEHYPVMPLPYAVLIAVYTVAQRWPLKRSALAVAAVAVGMGAGAMILLSPSLDDEPMIDAVAVLTAGALGRGVRMRQTRTALLEDRAVLLEEQSRRLAQEQQTMAELAAARERANIARELHDIVANNLSVIVAQAATTQRRAAPPSDGLATPVHEAGEAEVAPGCAESHAALATIESLGRETLGDMRRLVGVLQSTSGEAANGSNACLEQLEALVDKVAGSGTDVGLTVTGYRRDLPAAVELNAYRIVQESLTNAMKHAPGSRVEVLVDYGRDRLRLLVRDFGHHAGRADEGPAVPTTAGSGLVGMRQRVALLGGTLSTGPHPSGGYQVDATIPLRGGAADPRSDP